MEKEFKCPNCGTIMTKEYEEPALNLTCPKCGCIIATTIFQPISLDETIYEIMILPIENIGVNEIRLVSKISGFNYLQSKEVLEKGGVIYRGQAKKIKEIMDDLNKTLLNIKISPDFPY